MQAPIFVFIIGYEKRKIMLIFANKMYIYEYCQQKRLLILLIYNTHNQKQY